HEYANTPDKDNEELTYIADFGMSIAADSVAGGRDCKYGVIPYMAPELFRGQPHTKSSDVYAFGMIMWEVSSHQSPFSERDHDVLLMLDICDGLRPTIVEGTPKCWVDFMQRCWDPDPSERPTAREANDTVFDWYWILAGTRDDYDGIRQQFAEAEAYRKQCPWPKRQEQQHSGACYSSRLVPHITDEMITAYTRQDIEKNWTAVVSEC